jgi:hypothetical protein
MVTDLNSCRAGRGIKVVEANTSATWAVATAAPHHATGNRRLLSGFITEHDDLFVHGVGGMPMPAPCPWCCGHRYDCPSWCVVRPWARSELGVS